MIVPMSKVFVVARKSDAERLLETLRATSLVHLVPADPEKDIPDDGDRRRLSCLQRAIQILENTEGEEISTAASVTPSKGAEEAVQIASRSVELDNKLSALHRDLEQIAIWGDTRLQQIEALSASGIEPCFYIVANDELDQVEAECVQRLGEIDKNHTCIAVVHRGAGQLQLPESAEPIEQAQRDRASIMEEASEIDAILRNNAKRLLELKPLLPEIRKEELTTRSQVEFNTAREGGLDSGELFGVQGWMPSQEVSGISAHLEKEGLHAAIEQIEPNEDENPPSLIRYPAWVKPIRALFMILGTTPGYREYDLAPFFMLAMPIFTAMLVGDAGYGFIFTLIGLLSYQKLKSLAGAAAPQLIITFGVATMAWGILTANYFGVGPLEIGSQSLSRLMTSAGVLWRSDPEEGRNIVMMISFIIGCIHLMLAHLRRLVAFMPGQLAIAEAGWCTFIFAMFTLVWLMFFNDSYGPLIPINITVWLLAAGLAAIALFCHPAKNPLKRIAIGILSNLTTLSDGFGDMMSYIRLMAVGLASYYIASAFNDLAVGVAPSMGGAGIVFTILILVAAHTLNIILCLIAIFAHGVRLNMLEFSNNAGVQWSGTPFNPFRNICKNAQIQ